MNELRDADRTIANMREDIRKSVRVGLRMHKEIAPAVLALTTPEMVRELSATFLRAGSSMAVCADQLEVAIKKRDEIKGALDAP